MNSTWFNVAVVLVWLATMSWLVSQKVVPALLVGEPPNYHTVIEAQQEDPLVGWSMAWNGRQVGWALSATSRTSDGLTEVRSLVHFDDLPLEEIAGNWPGWLASLVAAGDGLPSRLQMEVNTRLIFDPLERLSQFDSSLGFPFAPETIKLRGLLDGTQLTLSVHSGDFTYQTKIALPAKALLSDAMSPQTQLPGLREGQTWSVEIFSPLRPPGSPVEILHAAVERSEPIVWNGRMVEALVVVYRDDPGAGTTASRKPRAKLWVRKDGTVLRQQATLLGSTMTFTRMPRHQAAALAHVLDSPR